MAAAVDEAAPTAAGRRSRSRTLAIALPAAIVLLVTFVAPLVAFVVYSFLTAGLYDAARPFTLEAYRDVFDSPVYGTLARNSVIIGALAAFFSVALALPVAYWLRFVAGRSRMLVFFLITASMFASYLVRIFAWRSILGSQGVLNDALTGIGIIDQPLEVLLYSRFAVTVALVHIFLPYVVLVVYAGLTPVSPGLLEAAQDLGANAFTRWRRVVLPLAAAPAISSALFVFVLASSDYVTPQLLGGTDGIMLGVGIKDSFLTVGNWPSGAALSILMLIAFAVLYGVIALALRLTKLDRIRFTT